jgi:hypothetical protein
VRYYASLDLGHLAELALANGTLREATDWEVLEFDLETGREFIGFVVVALSQGLL